MAATQQHPRPPSARPRTRLRLPRRGRARGRRPGTAAGRDRLPGRREARAAPRRAAELLTPAQREGDPDRYRQHLLHAEHDGSFSSSRWCGCPASAPPSTTTSPGASPASTRARSTSAATGCCPPRRRRERAARRHGGRGQPGGAVCGFAPPGDIHRVWNGCGDEGRSRCTSTARTSRGWAAASAGCTSCPPTADGAAGGPAPVLPATALPARRCAGAPAAPPDATTAPPGAGSAPAYAARRWPRCGVAAAWAVHLLVPAVPMLTAAVVLGIVAAHLPGMRDAACAARPGPGCRSPGKRLMRLGIVLLGLKLSLGDIARPRLGDRRDGGRASSRRPSSAPGGSAGGSACPATSRC